MGRRNGLSAGSITGEEGALPGRATALTRSKRRVGKFEQDKKSKPAPLRGQEAGQRFYYCRVREFDDGEGLDLDGRDTLAYASTTRTPHLRQRLYSGMPDGYSFVPLALSRPLDRPRAAFERQRPGETAPTAKPIPRIRRPTTDRRVHVSADPTPARQRETGPRRQWAGTALECGASAATGPTADGRLGGLVVAAGFRHGHCFL